MKPEAVSDMELTIQLDGQPICSITLNNNHSFVKHAVTGEIIPITEKDEAWFAEFSERYLLAPIERHIGQTVNDHPALRT